MFRVCGSGVSAFGVKSFGFKGFRGSGLGFGVWGCIKLRLRN